MSSLSSHEALLLMDFKFFFSFSLRYFTAYCSPYIIALMMVATGCSATGNKLTLEENGHQYCDTNKTIIEKNGVVDSTQITECSDDPVKKLLPPKMGIAKECREHWYSVNINGRMVERKGYACLMQGKDYETSKWYIVTSPF